MYFEILGLGAVIVAALQFTKVIDLNKLNDQLNKLCNNFELKYIDLYGGEITILDEEYVKKLIYCSVIAQSVVLQTSNLDMTAT